ncbi:MAG: hypothetical protein ACTHMS_13125 [Jatrophihabitans sp.]|uniref:hypothetical protein n=1 Tax=Jatrophihabitans sp. TaxID=1932789 RepID=UPI003F802DCA
MNRTTDPVKLVLAGCVAAAGILAVPLLAHHDTTAAPAPSPASHIAYDRHTGMLTGLDTAGTTVEYRLADGPAVIASEHQPGGFVAGFDTPPACGTVTWQVATRAGVLVAAGSVDLGVCPGTAPV